VIEANPDQVPIARPRASPVKVALSSASDSGTASAPPIPCSALAASTISIDGASAQASEATAKTAIPIMYIRRRPYRSPSAPPSRISAERNRV